MEHSFAEQLGLYDYDFPAALIAQAPVHPRDSARLLVFDRASHKTTFSTFHEIGKFLPKNSVLVLNETKVVPAKMELTRTTGGKVSALSLGASHDVLRVFANRKLRVGEFLTLHETNGFTVQASDEKEWLLKPNFPISDLQKMLDAYGTMPLPPYIKHSPLSRTDLRREYQSVFAKDPGSIAAPTASLHFTKALLAALEEQGIRLAYVTLHVHLGTFAPLTEEQWNTGHLHTEEYHIDAATQTILEEAKRNHHPLIAVGTTVARTLESASDASGAIIRPNGTTDLFIREGYTWNMVDGLITNFHVPKSSLLMLVATLTGRDTLLSLYQQAIAERMRLFSFGDGMLIL